MPRIRSPSVTTMTSTSRLGRFRSSVRMSSLCVQDRQHLFDVVEEEAVEEDLVGVLERPQIDVSSQVGLVCPERLIRPAALLVERLDHRRQQSVEPERRALGLGERGALVQERSLEKVDPPRAGLRSRCDRDARGFVPADDRLMLFQSAHGFPSGLRPLFRLRRDYPARLGVVLILISVSEFKGMKSPTFIGTVLRCALLSRGIVRWLHGSWMEAPRKQETRYLTPSRQQTVRPWTPRPARARPARGARR